MERGRPSDELIERVIEAAKREIRRHRVTWFCPGRTCNPAQRRNSRGAVQLVTLYRTTSVANAMAVEQALHTALNGHRKYDPFAAPDARGNTAPGKAQFVYLALEGDLEPRVRTVYRRL